jgi:integrase
MKLTQETVEGARCPPGRKDVLIFDKDTRGFALRVGKKGGKTFLAQYTTPAGKRRVTLGTFGVVTVAEARKAAQRVLGQAADAHDPFTERKAKAEADRVAKAEAAYTFGAMIEAWAKGRAGDRRPSYLREAVACVKRNLPKWWDRPAGSITVTEAVRVLDGVKDAKGTVAANRTLAYARAAYGWAAKRQAVRANPLKGIERAGREPPRERVLTKAELGAIWNACEKLDATRAGFVRTLLLTMQRREEVCSMGWAELDNPANPTAWTLPAERAKNGRTHVVHLAEAVRAIIKAMPRIKGNPFVFAGRDNGTIGGFSGIKDKINAEMVKARTPIADWRFHDFRRAGVTALADMGFPPHVCDRLLNHITGSIQGVAAVYQRAEFLNERKAALDAWAEHVLAAADGRTEAHNIVALSRRAG